MSSQNFKKPDRRVGIRSILLPGVCASAVFAFLVASPGLNAQATDGQSSVTPTSETISFTCGNNVAEPGEQCDDGNTKDGDGCGTDCQMESASRDVGEQHPTEAEQGTPSQTLGNLEERSAGDLGQASSNPHELTPQNAPVQGSAPQQTAEENPQNTEDSQQTKNTEPTVALAPNVGDQNQNPEGAENQKPEQSQTSGEGSTEKTTTGTLNGTLTGTFTLTSVNESGEPQKPQGEESQTPQSGEQTNTHAEAEDATKPADQEGAHETASTTLGKTAPVDSVPEAGSSQGVDTKVLADKISAAGCSLDSRAASAPSAALALLLLAPLGLYRLRHL